MFLNFLKYEIKKELNKHRFIIITMNIITCPPILVIVILGIITSYQDIKIGKIKNKWTFSAIIIGLILNTIILSYSSSTMLFRYYLNLIISIGFSVLLWINYFWSAGDVKLFVAYVALLPIAFTNSKYPSFILFINTIVPYFFYLLLKSLVFTKLKDKKYVLIDAIKQLPIKFIIFFVISWAIRSLSNYLGNESRVVYYIMLMVGYMIINLLVAQIFDLVKINKKYIFIFYLFVGIIRISFNYEIITDISYIKSVFYVTLLFIFIKNIAYGLGMKSFIKEVKIIKLKPGMLLVENILKNKGKYEKRKVVATDLFSSKALNYKPEGIENKEIQKLKQLYKNKKLDFNTIKVQESVAFAPIMFLGVIITILINTSIITYIMGVV